MCAPMSQMPQGSVSKDSVSLPVLLHTSYATPQRMLRLPLPCCSHQLNDASNHPPAPCREYKLFAKLSRGAQINTHLWSTNGSLISLEVDEEAVFFWWMTIRDIEKIKVYIELVSSMSESNHTNRNVFLNMPTHLDSLSWSWLFTNSSIQILVRILMPNVRKLLQVFWST